MKRIACLLITLMIAALGFSGAEQMPPKLRLIATIFPAYDFAGQIAGDTAEVKLLLPPGSESHSYEPTPQDIIAIQNADLFLYVGGESDAWVEGILASMGDNAPDTFRLMDCVTAVEEEQSRSMEAEGEEHTGEAEYDEHVWTSPKNAMKIVASLADKLSLAVPENAGLYAERLKAYQSELEMLDEEFTRIVAEGKRDVIIFGDRFPFRYFADAYGLRYDAAFPGCSEDSEPSVKTVMSLVDAVMKEQVPVIFYIEFSSRKTADTIAAETGAKTMLFHSCHNISAEELSAGATYLGLMENNAAALREALN